jgi:actin-related protein 6
MFGWLPVAVLNGGCAGCTHRRNPKNNPIVQQYVLPDFSPGNTTGYILSGPNANPPQPVAVGDGDVAKPQHPASEEQILWMNSERFTVPEVLFHPSDIGELERASTE